MNLLLFILFLLSPHSVQDNLFGLKGKWKLARIEAKNEIIIPQKKDYFLTVTEEGIAFKKDVNSCMANPVIT